jgi:putative FmdB family regulatory protein
MVWFRAIGVPRLEQQDLAVPQFARPASDPSVTTPRIAMHCNVVGCRDAIFPEACCNGLTPKAFAEVRVLPTYGYLCSPCGAFQVVRPMADDIGSAVCPECGQPARRVFGSPGLQSFDPGMRSALDASARSAENPRITSNVPGRSRRPTPVTRDPRHAKLPRP